MLTPTNPNSSSRPVRILYAEDVRELRLIAKMVFERDGHSIECVCDGVAALERLQERPDAFDLLITDHHMPRMNGLDLVINVRRIPFHGKIMVFSSDLNPSTAAEYGKQGVDRLLFKPVYPSYLRQTIEELFPADAELAGHHA